MPDFDQLADIYWRLGGMQSPSQLHGYLVGVLSAGGKLTPELWIEQAAQYIDAVTSPDSEDSRVLVALYEATDQRLSAGEMELQLLLPDDAAEISQRIDSIAQWCEGYIAGFARQGKVVQQQQGQQQYSGDVSETLSDIAAISQVGLSSDDEDPVGREQDIFEISEYLRLAAITVYLECNKEVVADAVRPVDTEEAKSSISPAGLFNKKSNKLH
jgi:yecA family protein